MRLPSERSRAVIGIRYLVYRRGPEASGGGVNVGDGGQGQSGETPERDSKLELFEMDPLVDALGLKR